MASKCFLQYGVDVTQREIPIAIFHYKHTLMGVQMCV